MVEKFEPAVEEILSKSQVPGLAVAVVQNGQEVYAKAFGVKNIETGEALTTDSLFHWASVTKPFVGTAIIQLVEQGKIDLEAPVVQYVPYFKVDDERYASITVGQMVSHTAGMPDVIDYEWDKPVYDDGALERYVRGLSDKKLIAAPGEKMRYSNIAFEVLGDAIAKVSGMTFEAYVEKHILIPAGMSKSTLLKKEAEEALLTSPHTVEEKKCVLREHWPYNRMHAPSSTMISNVHDMCRWAMINLNRGELDGKRILRASSYDLLWSPRSESFEWIGISWFLGEHRGHRTVGHGGGDLGFRSNFTMLPDEGLAFVMVSNTDRAPVEKITQLALDAILGIEP
jgi:CubicO group peptidase (beta-lactamase class C family)